MNLSEQLRDAVNNSGASINSIAKEAGLDQSCLQRFAKGQRPHLSAESMNKLAAYLGMRLTKPRKIV